MGVGGEFRWLGGGGGGGVSRGRWWSVGVSGGE